MLLEEDTSFRMWKHHAFPPSPRHQSDHVHTMLSVEIDKVIRDLMSYRYWDTPVQLSPQHPVTWYTETHLAHVNRWVFWQSWTVLPKSKWNSIKWVKCLFLTVLNCAVKESTVMPLRRTEIPHCTCSCAVNSLQWIHCTSARAVHVQSLLVPITIPGLNLVPDCTCSV